MNKKIFNNTRVCPKGDTETNWNKAVGFVPLDKEIIIYKADDTHSAARFKVGDGKTAVQDLPFSGTDIEAIQKLIDEKGELLIEYIDNAVAAIEIPEVDQVYNSESENAQSGIAVSEALKPIEERNNKQDNKIAKLEGRVTIATFNTTEANITVALKNLEDMTQIDWGDGSINNELNHAYVNVGEYICKIYDVTSIGDMAFYNCDSLTSIIIPDSVTSIGYGAFADCSSLTRAVIGNGVTSIGYGAFDGCSSLTSIEIPDSVTSISDSAFYNCSSLTEIVIPDSVTSIGRSAFSSCSSLTDVIFKNSIPITYNSQYSWFNGCTSLTHIYVPYGCKQLYIDKWVADGATQDILDKIIESDREAMMSDVDTLKSEIQAELVGKTDYLGTTDTMPNFSAAGAGDYCRVLVEFVYDETTGEIAHVGDILIALKDNPTQNKADWDLVHTELNSATMVTVGGEAQVNWEADTKLDKITTTYGNNVHRLYAIGNQGQQYVITTTDSNNVVATQEYADKKIINLHATDILTNQDAAAFIVLTKDILDGKCNVFVKLNNATGALVTEIYYSETACEWRVFGQAGKAFYTLTAVIDGENQSITLTEESLGSILVQFMTEYLNSEETAANKPTAAEISAIFNENEEV